MYVCMCVCVDFTMPAPTSGSDEWAVRPIIVEIKNRYRYREIDLFFLLTATSGWSVPLLSRLITVLDIDRYRYRYR